MLYTSFDMHKRTFSQKGFTIIELLIVIVVIGILAAIVIVSYNGVTQRTYTATLQTDLRSALSKIDIYRSDNGRYPSSLSALSSGVPQSNDGAEYTYVYDALSDTFCLSLTSTRNGIGGMTIDKEGVITSGACTVPLPSFITTSLPDATQSTAYTASVQATSAVSVTYGATGLPAGLSINSTSGVISGTPTATGTSNVALTATNSGGTTNVTLPLVVSAMAAPVYSPTSLAVEYHPCSPGFPNYTYTHTATGPGTISYSVQSGTLPPAFTLNSSTGVLSGTVASPVGNPTVYNFVLAATNSGGTGTRSVTMTLYRTICPS